VTAFRVYVDGQLATRDLARSIEQIEVSQMTSAPWDAQIVIPICLDRFGEWDHEAEHYVAGRTRFRIELEARGQWVPLIDGVTVGAELALSGDPNQSSVVVRVQDHTAELERDRGPRTFGADRGVGDVVRSLLDGRTYVERGDVEDPTTTPVERHASDELTMSETSVYDFLRTLASDHGMYMYVLPARDAGQRSRAMFGAMPRPSGERAPDLILAGPNRNIERFDVSSSSNAPGRVVSRSMNIRDRAVETTTITLSEREVPAGAEPAADEEVELSPSAREKAAVGPDQAAAALLERAGFVIRGNGAVEGRCYSGVLQPYSYVNVSGVNRKLTGTYLVYAVTHRITRASYRQEFTLWRNTLATATRTETSASGMVPW
jgi:hypothetical protein